tara:strand:- start:918 stop:1670 length:753 start_codon:yes stop_codon:yes gene_type:complete
MAFKTISETDTLETFRTTFNDLSQLDFGDIANLNASISATNLVDAMNETISIATSSSGFTIADDTSTAQLVGGGDTLTVLGTANQIQSVVSVPDTITFSFPNTVEIPNILNVLGVTTLGTIEINGNQISSTNSGTVEINDTLKAGVTTINPTGSNNVESSNGFTVFGSSIFMGLDKNIFFEGTTDNAFDTKLTAIDPTAIRAISLPDADGTVALTNTTAYATGSIFASTSTLIIYDSTGSEVKRIVGSAT